MAIGRSRGMYERYLPRKPGQEHTECMSRPPLHAASAVGHGSLDEYAKDRGLLL